MSPRPPTRTTASRAVVALLAVAGLLTVGPSSAMARWRVHNGEDVTQVIAPPGGTEQQTCADHLRGESGWHTNVPVGDNPEDYSPPSESGAFGRLSYDVWKAPRGHSVGTFSESDTGPGVRFSPEGSSESLPAILVRRFDTPPRADIPAELLWPDEIETDPNGSNLYLFSRARFSVPLSDVVVGALVGLKPSSTGSTFINLKTVDCDVNDLHINVVRYDPKGRDVGINRHVNKEFVRITNGTDASKRLTGWTLRDRDGHRYRFSGTRLRPGDSVVVHTGKGDDRPGHRYWGRQTYRWDNRGEVAVLRSHAGVRMDACRWGDGPGTTTC
jgi:hypothetical protein